MVNSGDIHGEVTCRLLSLKNLYQHKKLKFIEYVEFNQDSK